MYTKDSLETLRHKIDLVEVLSMHLDLKRSGGAFKALCPFHDEKSPSFMLQRGDDHYHCFGCGAHGDAIAFLMGHLKMSFVEAIEHLAEKFQVTLEIEDKKSPTDGVSKPALKEALRIACRFYHFYLLYSEEGQEALTYLYRRGIDLEFIKLFQIGLAPKVPKLFQSYMKENKVEEKNLIEAGLISIQEGGRKKDFFFDRVTFPIKDAFGHVIGFSARKMRDETFGPKYINTPETPLFKKSHVLFGMSECRKRIAKERKVIIVEGQIDTLSLIQSGFNFTVAAQGTAFTESHGHELIQLGVHHVYLAFDGDEAGRQAAIKVGNLFQKEGIEVSVCELPNGQDPDQFLKESGPEAFVHVLESSEEYLKYVVKEFSKVMNIETPSGKTELVNTIAKKIQTWNQPLMIHESLKKLAELTGVPEALVLQGKEAPAPVQSFKPRPTQPSYSGLDPNRVLEADFLRWLLLSNDKQLPLIKLADRNIKAEHLRIPACQKLYELLLERYQANTTCDLLSIGQGLQDPEGQEFLSEILHKKVNFDKAEDGLLQVMKKILEREWFLKRETIKISIQSGKCSEEEVLSLAKQFDELKKQPPIILMEDVKS